ncbi:MAG: PAS domain S-box protein [FCB group bacterium]|nr:PAS domain S-box protein [FCB group bacterium]MBL7026912.1 PAS domain S-box protein [Candidatus Neomarinimicrobiota bacterium]MBL7120471.1 PAS domain S-box protein [Candidatus Neomarinimicrobiota bacterium]
MKPNHTFADGNTTSILDNLNTAVFRANLDGSASIIDVNPAFIKMFGYKDKTEIESISIVDFYVDPADRIEMRNELTSQGNIRNREMLFKRKDGSVFPGRVSSVLVKDSKGKSLFIDGVVDDISELKAKEEELLAEQKVFFSGPVVLIQWPVHENEALINISENVVDLLGYETSDFLDGKILYPDLVHEEDKPELQNHIRSILAGGSDIMLVHPYRLRRKTGDYIWVQDYAFVQRDSTGKAVGILGYIYDVTDLQVSQRESVEKEQRLRDLVENSPTGILRINGEGNIVEVNQRMVDMLGSPSKEATQKFNMFNFQPLVDAGITGKFQEAISENKIISFAGEYDSNWGKNIHFKLIISPVLDAEGQVIGAQANMEDVSKAFLAEADKRELQKIQLEERRIFMAGPIMIIKWAYSADDPVLSVSENVEQILGYTAKEFMSSEMVPSKLIHPDDLEKVRSSTHDAMGRGESAFELAPYRLKKKDGNYIWVSDYSTVSTSSDGKSLYFSDLVWDVTSRIQILNELKTALKDQEFLLREIHHRVKNNMQVIISLLNIQAEYSSNEQLSEIFSATQNRIRSMALVHDKLFKSKQMSAVDFGSYINSLVLELKYFYGIDTPRINIHQKIDDIKLDISKAIPCGLIVNELVTNSMKYAFPDKREGGIWISAGPIGDNKAKIEIKDNGVGLGEDLVFEETKSMGLRIVRILTEQLGGTMEINTEKGSSFSLTFDLMD